MEGYFQSWAEFFTATLSPAWQGWLEPLRRAVSITRFGGQVGYAACLRNSAVRSYSTGLM